jgi:hypothetical protein
MTQLAVHFSLEELTRSSTATRLGIDNTPDDTVLANLQLLADGLENVRELLGVVNTPMIIDSGYRCPQLNRVIGGATNSAHTLGFAADFICPSVGTPLSIVSRIVASDLQFDQVIQEGNWVHISFAPAMRRSVLTAHFVNGVAHYTEGL